MRDKRLRLPNEDVRLTPDEVAITQTRVFQRLFNLKQLGLAYLVYPNATHTRGVHSLRCLSEAVRIIEGLRSIGEKPSPEENQDIRVAALLHDVGHIPFSHTLEDEHTVLPKHDRPERLKQVLSALKDELQPEQGRLVDRATPILHAIAGGERATSDWRSDLVGNTVCADLLAYMTADADATGIEKRPGHYRIYEYFQTHKGRLCVRLTKEGFRTDIVSAIMDILDMRYALTERVIFHHAKCVASAMLARAARLCGLASEDEAQLIQIGDEGFFAHLQSRAAKLEQTSKQDATGARRLLYCLEARRLYARIFKVGRQARDHWDEGQYPNAFCARWRDGAAASQLLESVEDRHQLPRGSLVLWCPDQVPGRKLIETQIVWETAAGLQGPRTLRTIGEVGAHFAGVAKRVETMEGQYSDLWTFWVAIDRDYAERTAEVVQTLEDELDVECDEVFRETYLKKKLAGFESRSKRLRDVGRVLGGLQGTVLQSMSGQKGLSGEVPDDETVILEATKAAIEQKLGTAKGPKRRRSAEPDTLSRETQAELLPEDATNG
jgi:HD superfamily phosphohydrolase